MNLLCKNTVFWVSCIVASIAAHVVCLFALNMFGRYEFVAPINQHPIEMVAVSNPGAASSPYYNSQMPESKDIDHAGEDEIPPPESTPDTEKENNALSAKTVQIHTELNPLEPSDTGIIKSGPDYTSLTDKSCKPVPENSTRHLLKPANEFLATRHEKLTYVISMLGLPIGSAELEANNENGDIWIALRVKSNTAVSSIYPVDNLVETRHVDGQFIMTRIIQQEGSFRSDSEFTINLRKKRVSWFDHIRNLSLKTTVPTDDVLDTLSGIYFLRNRQLQVGKTETLHIYDSETYADVPVEIVRRETMCLPNFEEIQTLVVRPLQQTAGIFRRTGEILIWLTDDAYKVPVKIVTSIALGKVTADLVSAESKLPEEVQKK